MEKIIRLSKSCIGEAEKAAVSKVLDHEFLGMGEEVRCFEEALSIFLDRECVCVVNGTAALHLAVQACGIGPGDEVLVQSLTYVASFQAISAAGATPIACDVIPQTCTIDLKDAEERLSPKTKAIMPVHYSGGVGDLDEIYNFAKKHNLRVIEDAAHAFGTKFNGQKIGAFGDITCFSFDGIKNLTCGEGACIATDDKDVLEKIKDARLLGIINDSERRYTGKRSWDFDVKEQGWRYHMSNIMAAIGREQLRKFPEIAKKRQDLARLYDSILKKNSDIIRLPHDYDQVVPHIYAIRVNDLKDRQLLQKKLLNFGIQTGVHYKPNHKLHYFKNLTNTQFLRTEEIYPKLLTLPLHTDLTLNDVKYVCERLNYALEFV